MARFTGGAHSPQTIRDLLRSIEIIAIVIAISLALGIWAASSWLARDWLHADKLPVETVAQAFAIMGGVSALRFVEGIYRSSIIGLQRQVLFNILNCIMATLRAVGAVAILVLVSPTIEAFFLWQGVISLLTIGLFATTTYLALPPAGRRGHFSPDALREVRHFAGGVFGITLLSLLLMQVDKILLSKLLSLKDYGYYTLASVVSASVFMLVSPISTAWFPRLSELITRNQQASLAETYHKGAQLVTVVMGSTAIVIIVFSEAILRLWTHDDDLTRHTATLVSLLTLGNMLNSLMWIPYQTQLAYGFTGLVVRINIASVLIIVPALLWVTPRYGAEGAAWVWIGLNAGYILIGVHIMYRTILTMEKWRWYTQDIAMPLVGAGSTAILLHWLIPAGLSTIGQIFALALAVSLTLVAATLMAPTLRRQLRSYLSQLRP